MCDYVFDFVFDNAAHSSLIESVINANEFFKARLCININRGVGYQHEEERVVVVSDLPHFVVGGIRVNAEGRHDLMMIGYLKLCECKNKELLEKLRNNGTSVKCLLFGEGGEFSVGLFESDFVPDKNYPLYCEPLGADGFSAVLWSTSHEYVIHKIIDINGYFGARLYIHPDNEADEEAIAIVSDLPHFVVGGIRVNAVNRDDKELHIIGYISRKEPRKKELYEKLRNRSAPLKCKLINGAFTVRCIVEDDDDDNSGNAVNYVKRAVVDDYVCDDVDVPF